MLSIVVCCALCACGWLLFVAGVSVVALCLLFVVCWLVVVVCSLLVVVRCLLSVVSCCLLRLRLLRVVCCCVLCVACWLLVVGRCCFVFRWYRCRWW